MKPKSPHVLPLVLSALFLALTFLATLLSFPAPLLGNLNLGDGVLLTGVSLLGIPGVIAGALGAALCDLVGPYAIYAPATLIIKLLMGFAAYGILKLFQSREHPRKLALLLAGFFAELIMVAGYYFYEAIFVLRSFAGALANIPFNLIQGAVGVTVFFLASGILGKWKR